VNAINKADKLTFEDIKWQLKTYWIN
jgi:hypothetical protein